LTELQKKILFGNSEKIDPSTGWTHLPFRWPTNLNGFVEVPVRIQTSEGFSK
jgi:hypothetical protein